MKINMHFGPMFETRKREAQNFIGKKTIEKLSRSSTHLSIRGHIE